MIAVGHHVYASHIPLCVHPTRTRYQVYSFNALCGVYYETGMDTYSSPHVEDLLFITTHGLFMLHHDPVDAECEACILLAFQREAERAANETPSAYE